LRVINVIKNGLICKMYVAVYINIFCFFILFIVGFFVVLFFSLFYINFLIYFLFQFRIGIYKHFFFASTDTFSVSLFCIFFIG